MKEWGEKGSKVSRQEETAEEVNRKKKKRGPIVEESCLLIRGKRSHYPETQVKREEKREEEDRKESLCESERGGEGEGVRGSILPRVLRCKKTSRSKPGDRRRDRKKRRGGGKKKPKTNK